MKEELSISGEKLANLEEGSTQPYEESNEGKLATLNSAWKEFLRIASFILYVQLILFAGWGSYTIWDNFRVRSLEAKVTNVLIPPASYSPGEVTRVPEMEQINKLLTTELQALDLDLDLDDLLKDPRHVPHKDLPPLQEANIQGNFETITRESIVLNKGAGISKETSNKMERDERIGEFSMSREFGGKSASEQVSWYQRNDIIGSNLYPLLWSIYGIENSAGISSADAATSQEKSQSERVINSIEQRSRKAEADRSGSATDNWPEFNPESDQPMYQGYRKYKCTYHMARGVKCDIMKPSDKTNEENSESADNTKYPITKRRGEADSIARKSGIFHREDYIDDYQDYVYDDWEQPLEYSNERYHTNENIDWHNRAEIESAKLEKSRKIDTAEEAHRLAAGSQLQFHSQEYGNSIEAYMSQDHVESSTLSGETGNRNPKTRAKDTRQINLQLDFLSPPPSENEQGQSQQSSIDFGAELRIEDHDTYSLLQSSLLPSLSFSTARGSSLRQGLPSRIVRSTEPGKLSASLVSLGEARNFKQSYAHDFFKKMQLLTGHIDRLHAHYFRANKLDDDYISQEFPSYSFER